MKQKLNGNQESATVQSKQNVQDEPTAESGSAKPAEAALEPQAGGGSAPSLCSASGVSDPAVLSYIDFICPRVASLCGMPQYKDAAMDELLRWFVEWCSQSHQVSEDLLERVSGDQIKTNLYKGP